MTSALLLNCSSASQRRSRRLALAPKRLPGGWPLPGLKVLEEAQMGGWGCLELSCRSIDGMFDMSHMRLLERCEGIDSM